MKEVEKKAAQLSKSVEFAGMKDSQFENFSLDALNAYFAENGGLIKEVIHAMVGREDPVVEETVAAAIALNARSQKCSSFQKVLGIILRAGGCDTEVPFFSFFFFLF